MPANSPFQCPQYRVNLARIRPKKNERRFYAAEINTDLFGVIVLVRCWGRIGTSGRMRHEPHLSFAAAQASLDVLERSKRRRGYLDRDLSAISGRK